jgi:allantoin racemase
VRIKYLVPFALDDQGVALRAANIPAHTLGLDTHVEAVAVRNHPRDGSGFYASFYESAVTEMYMTEAGLRAETEGYDAVVMDSTSDSGVVALRSRLTIPVIGPGLVSYTVATMLGSRFSIVSYLHVHNRGYLKTVEDYHLQERLASIRSAGINPDYQALFGDDGEEAKYARLAEAASKAIEEDGAEVIVLGSTTMGQAADYMSRQLPAPVINPSPLAIKLAESLVLLGLSHSKLAYPSPPATDDEIWQALPGIEERGTK